MGTRWFAGAGLLGVVFAQEPPMPKAGEVDIAALAAKIDVPAGSTDILAALPEGWLEDLQRRGSLLTPAERDVLFAEQCENVWAKLAAAVAVLRVAGAPGEARAEDCLRELSACQAIYEAARRLTAVGVFAPEVVDKESLTHAPELAATANRRFRAVAKLFLLQHAEHAGVGRVLVECAEYAPNPLQTLLDGLRRLGARASAFDCLRGAQWCFHAGDLVRAQALLEASKTKEAARLRFHREYLDAWQRRLPMDFDAWRRLGADVDQPGLPGRIAGLQSMCVLGKREAALATSRGMLEEGVAHALPSSLLAVACLEDGRRQEMRTHLARALELPGADSLKVALLIIQEGLTLSLSNAKVPKLARQKISALRAQCRAVLQGSHEPEARLIEGVLDLFHSEEDEPDWLRITATAAELARRLADVAAAQHLALSMAWVSEDPVILTAALAASAKVPAEMGFARMRAELATQVLALGDGQPSAVALQVLADYAEFPGCSGDAAYLRGVVAWARGERDTAREQFARVPVLPLDREGWQAVLARWISGGLGEDENEVRRVRELQSFVSEPQLLVPALASWLVRDPSAKTIEAGRELLARLGEKELNLAVLQSALATAYLASGDRAAARQAAKQSLAALPATGDNARLYERGLFVHRETRWGFGASLRGCDVRTRMRCAFYILPELPSLERLKELARDG